jgi:beta-xylosidase
MRLPLILIIIFAMIFIVRAISQSTALEQHLRESKGHGSCSDLPEFGVSTHQRRNPDNVNIRLVSEVHARIVRVDVPWSEVEQEGRYQFSSFDQLIDGLRASGKSIILVLAYGHPEHSDGIAKSGLPLPPRTPQQRAAYSKYVQAVAVHYHGSDIVYEVWNEPNFAWFWSPAPDADAYGKLLADAVTAIRAVEPNATIISGGLANVDNPSEFLHELARAGALDRLDGITFHPYRRDAPEDSLDDIAEFESAATGHTQLPLWITEWGYSELWLGKSSSDVRRSQGIFVARLMLTAALAKAKAALIYDLIDDGINSNDQESSFGLYDYNFKPKPAATAFRVIAQMMSDCETYEFTADPSGEVIMATFRGNSATSIVAWTYATAGEKNYCLGVRRIRDAKLADIFGNQLPLSTCPGSSGIEVKFSDSTGPLVLMTR